jgi:RNA polymerase sigma-70 factor (ECF subfamily)
VNKVSINVLTFESDQEIIREYTINGNSRAATAFVRKYQSFVYATALRFLRDHDDADDAAQESFIKALRNLKSFRGDSSVKTWLYRITTNVCSNHARKRNLRSMFSREVDDAVLEFPDNNPLPDKNLESKEFEQNFLNALNRLPEKQRETFALRYFDDLTYEEISEMLGTSTGGLKANYFQAVQKLTKYLKN